MLDEKDLKNCTVNGIPQEEIIRNGTTCFDCKHHFMSDSYLECYLHDRINNKNICFDFVKENK